MKKIIYKSKAIQAVIIIIAAILLLSLWPFRIWQEIVTTSMPPKTGSATEGIDDNRTLLQSFVAQYDHMDSISIYLGEETTGESFFVRILNESQQMICEEEVFVESNKLPGYQEVLIDVDMEVGKTYHCIIQGNESMVFAGCEQVSPEEAPYGGTMYYADSTVEGKQLTADYHYSVPLRKGKVFAFGAAIALTAALLVAAVGLLYRKKDRDKLITAEKAFQYTMNPIAAGLIIAALTAVAIGACGSYLLDNTIFLISILLLGMILGYGINHNRDGQEPVVTLDYIKSHLPDLLQAFFIAGAISACCEYMSGLYDIHHAVAQRKQMIWFALAIIVMFKWKEICNLYNAVYLAGAGIYGYTYYQRHLMPEMGELDVKVLKYTVWVAVLLGIIIIRTVISLCRRRLSRLSFLYAGIITVFFALIIIFRNGRWWTVAMAVSFTLFYLAYGAWEHKERLLVNICRGILFQFIMATGYVLLHRPFVTFRTARYTHIFHTVTITATYLTMVECAAAVLFLYKFSKSRKLKDTWKELLLFGVVSSYLLFTMSRTAYFAVGATLLSALLIMINGKGKEWFKNLGMAAGIMVLSVLVCVPVTFTLQRTVPALASDPYLYEIESYPDDILRGRKLDSVEFMRVGRFIDVFADKIFGLPEGTFDIYGEIAAYREENGGETAKTPEQEKWVEGVESCSGLIASVASEPEGLTDEEDNTNDYTNGRIDIFTSYIEQLNMTGHEEMGALLKDGSIATHAHNIYLQVAYDHGIPVGIVFVLVGAATFFAGCLFYFKRKCEVPYAALPVVVITAVAVAGIVEWIFHISNPCGFILMLVITPLLYKSNSKRSMSV